MEVGCVEVGMVGRGRSDVAVGVEALDCWSTLSEIYTNTTVSDTITGFKLAHHVTKRQGPPQSYSAA